MSAEAVKPAVVLTMGDPAGVGPEVVLRALAEPKVRRALRPILVGDAGVFRETARRLRIPLDLGRRRGQVPIVEVSELGPQERRPGRPCPAGAAAAYRAILDGVRLVQDGSAQAIVTAPVSKAAVRALGVDFVGHTETIARLAGGAEVRMMMAGRELRVVLATTHIPFREVPEKLTPAHLARSAEIASLALRRHFGIPRPRLALAGLNPHAGEGGAIGDEERRVLEPAVERARRRGIRLEGPFPADTVFYRARQGEFDAVLALYHDQGLAPFKLVHFRDGVNVTIGLPFPRTSPDHGTAFDRAGRRPADPASMISACLLAARMSGFARRG